MTLGRASAPTQVHNQRGRAALSSNADTSGASRRLAYCGAIEALLDRSTTGRATKRWRIDPSWDPPGAVARDRLVATATAGRGGRALRMRSCRRRRPGDRKRGIAVTPSREAARSHSRGRRRGDGGCGPGPLARNRLAPRRREITFGRQRNRRASMGSVTKAIVDAGAVSCPVRARGASHSQRTSCRSDSWVEGCEPRKT